MSDSNEIGLLLFDVDRIKQFVFAGHRPLDATGASEMVKGLDVDGVLWGTTLADLPVEVIYAKGGSGLLRVRDAARTEAVARRIEGAFREQTLTGSCTAVALTEKADVFESVAGFRRALRSLHLGLARRKAEKAADECPEAWTMGPVGPNTATPDNWVLGYEPRCEACGIYPARGTDSLEEEKICPSCRRKRELGRALRQRCEQQWLRGRVQRPPMAFSLSDIAGGAEGGYVAAIYVDVNHAGSFLEGCGSPAEAAALSDHLWGTVEAGLSRIPPAYAGRYQQAIAGGDDLVLFVPGAGCAEFFRGVLCAMEEHLRRPPLTLGKSRVGEALRAATLSAGLLVADSHLPIPFLFELVESLRHSARTLSYSKRETAVDFLRVTGGMPLNEGVTAARRAHLWRSLAQGESFPEKGSLRLVTGIRLTRLPYTLAEFGHLLDITENLRQEKDAKGVLRQLANALRTERALEAYFTIGYQRARHRELAQIPLEILYQVANDDEGNEAVETGIIDLLELMAICALSEGEEPSTTALGERAPAASERANHV